MLLIQYPLRPQHIESGKIPQQEEVSYFKQNAPPLPFFMPFFSAPARGVRRFVLCYLNSGSPAETSEPNQIHYCLCCA